MNNLNKGESMNKLVRKYRGFKFSRTCAAIFFFIPTSGVMWNMKKIYSSSGIHAHKDRYDTCALRHAGVRVSYVLYRKKKIQNGTRM